MMIDQGSEKKELRVMYNDHGLCGWYTPVMTSRELTGLNGRPIWGYPLVGQVVITSRGSKGLATREAF